MKILVTGGAGFIGGAVIRHIISKTSFDVINVDKLTYAGNLDSLKEIENSSRYNFEKVDICDEEGICRIFDKYQPTMIMHLAAESHVDRSITGPFEFLRTNILGTYNLLQQSLKYYSKKNNLNKKQFKFHHISTDEVFGDLENDNDFFNELTPYAPSSPYSASKASSDHLVRAWGRTYDLPFVITNCSNNYGPYHYPEKLIPATILNALNGSKINIYGKGDQIRDWLYVDDHASALLDVIINSSNGETYNIGGNNEKTNIEVVETICEILEELSPIKPKSINRYCDLITHVEDRPGHDRRYAIDSSKIQNELGWKPKENFESGLRKTVEWYLKNEDWWKRLIKKS
tara:strand:+ start:2687 stop:3721 length:1035 start_codon:yes stop_codon:yes gene_type:complete